MESTKPVTQGKGLIDQMVRECLLSRTRMLNRVVTGIYDDELRSFGLKATQLNLLALLVRVGPIRRIDIGKHLHLDPSTLTRNLRVMLTNGWIEEIADGEDGRGSPLQATVQGRDLVNQVGPAWRKAQDRVHKLIGDSGATLMRKLAANMSGLPSG